MHWVFVWQWDWGLCSAMIVFAVTYVLAWRRLRRRGNAAATTGRLVWWFAGLVTVAVAALSAIDDLSLSYFSMHMVQHVLFIDLAPPLLLMGRPLSVLPGLFTDDPQALDWSFLAGNNRLVRAFRFVLRAPTAWLLATVVICVWHVPDLYNFGLNHEVLHDLGEHVSMFVAFLIWWHPLIGSRPELPYLKETRYRFYYLLLTILTTRSLGLVILFWPHVLYSFYITHGPAVGGISLMLDQQLGGLVMLAGGMAVFLAMALPLQYQDEFPLVFP